MSQSDVPQKTIIKCPYCSAKLKIASMPENKKGVAITCPICKHKSLLSDFIVVNANNLNDGGAPSTQEGRASTGAVQRKMSSEETLIGTLDRKLGQIGSLVMPDGGMVRLHVGVNTIGRRAQASQSEIQFADINNSKKASRHHARIEVIPQSSGSYLHTISNWENKNGTMVNGVKLNEGDTVVLHDGDLITCGDVPLRFVIVVHENTLPQENTGA